MSGTEAQANNVSVEFKGRLDVPSTSQDQNAAMHAAAEGKSTLGIPRSVGKEFVKADEGRKVKKLPKHVRRAHKRGLISDSQMSKLRGE